ncbi:hypothetical protein IAU59_002151 [Kwoniella sp. CBS 9459]
MSIIRPFDPIDILRFNNVNADAWTATYHNGYYASYTAQWPDFCVTVEGAFDEGIKAYMIAKHEPPPPDPQHHGHLTALSISPSYRSLGLARVLMDILEGLSGESGNKGHEHDHSNCGGHHDHGHDHAHGHDHGHNHSHGHNHQHDDHHHHHDHDHHHHDHDDGHDHHEHHHHADGHRHDGGGAAPPQHPDAVDAWFVDLFVRCNNHRAIEMYERMGYSVYRRVVDYYHGMEGIGSTRDELDGFDMRKSMPRDTSKRYVRPNGRDILVSPDQVWA